MISRRAGENRPGEIGRVFNHGILISLCIAAFGILFTWFIAPGIFKTFIHDTDVQKDVTAFLRIRIFGLAFLYIYQMRNALLVGINQSQLLVVGTLAEAVANVIFDYALIFGHFGMPAMGFNGAAVASVISEFIGMFVIFLVIRQKGINKRFALFQEFRYDPAIIRTIVNISGPLAFQHAISIVSWFFFYILVEHHGATSLAVSNTMRNIFGFFGSFIWAFSSTTNTMVSNVIGQGKSDQVIGLIFRIMKLSLAMAAGVCLFLNVFPETFLAIYGQGEAFMTMGVPVLRVVAFSMLLMSIGTIWLNAVTGTGNGRMTFIIELIAITLYCIYVFIVLEVQRYSIIWGWMSEVLYWSILFLLSYSYIKSKRWMKTKL